MRRFSLCAICFAISLCGIVAAQQNLVEYNDKDDRCARFKMRILVPADQMDLKRRAQKPMNGIDYRMVWNPCPQPQPQFAFVRIVPAPKRVGNLQLPQSGLQYTTRKNAKPPLDK